MMVTTLGTKGFLIVGLAQKSEPDQVKTIMFLDVRNWGTPVCHIPTPIRTGAMKGIKVVVSGNHAVAIRRTCGMEDDNAVALHINAFVLHRDVFVLHKDAFVFLPTCENGRQPFGFPAGTG
jgi:hypothetical protein